MITTKSVHSPIDKKRDGFRVLVSRFRGRGLPKSAYDAWVPSLGPSEKLLRSFLGGKLTWAAFQKEYKAELLSESSIDKKNRVIKNHGQKFTLRLLAGLGKRGTVTLLCQCSETEPKCHRRILKKLIETI
jgi:uncharacterized protein YeaO (DUF488 family)